MRKIISSILVSLIMLAMLIPVQAAGPNEILKAPTPPPLTAY